MVLDNYSDMSIDELGSSLLQKKDEDARRAAKRSKKNERIQQALAVMMLGQGVMKNQYKKRAKELEDLHKFEILNNENESKQINVTSGIVSTIGNNWKDEGGDLDSRVESFSNSEDYNAFSQKVLPFIQQKIKAATGEEYDTMYNTSAYNNAVDLATKQFARQYLENDNYKNYESQLRTILDEKDLDRVKLFELGSGLDSHTLTQYEKRNYQKVLSEARAQGNLLSGFRKVLGLFNDKYKSEGGFDIFSPATEADLAGPTMRDINQALNLKGMTNNIVDNALAEASKSPTRWRERGRSKAHTNLRNNVGDFQSGPIAEMARLIDDDIYPSEVKQTMTRINGNNVVDLIEELEKEPSQKEAFVLDVTALSLRLKEDRKFLQAVYQNTEGKKGKGRKSFSEFREIMSDDTARIQFSAMLAINEGFKDSEYLKWDEVSYNSYGTLPAIYNSVGLANVLGDGISVTQNGELNLGSSYTKMSLAEKQTAIKNEADDILRNSSSEQERNIRLGALEEEIDVNFDQDMQSFLEDLATEKRNAKAKVKQDALSQAGATQSPLPFETVSREDTTEEILGTPRGGVQPVSIVADEPKAVQTKAKMVDAVLTNVDEDKPEEIKENRLIPINIRQMMYDIFGGDGDVTEEDLSGNELQALRSIITPEVLRKGKLEYADYGTTKGNNVYSDVGGGGQGNNPIAKSFSDPAYALKTTLGQAKVFTDKNGNVIIEDRYNFNDADDQVTFDSFLDDLRAIKSDWKYFLPRKTAKYFGSKEGEGSKILINLGKLDIGTFV